MADYIVPPTLYRNSRLSSAPIKPWPR